MSVLDASSSILYHWDLVRKTYFPREVLPASIVISNLVHFVLALIVFFAYLLVLGAPILVSWLLVPVVILIQLLLNLGIAFFVSCLNVFYEDVKYLMTVVLTLLFYLMPIMYLVEQIAASDRIPEVWKPLIIKFYFANPLSFILIAYRKLLLPAYHAGNIHDIPMSFWHIVLAAVTSTLVFIAGYAFFNKKKWYFAERV
jgi:ABC-type polysaccharide/polyol phosphate export permease